MAKLAFSKLGLKANQEIKIIKFNEQDIEVKQYLPVDSKLDLIANVINQAHNGSSNFSNPVQVKVFTVLEILYFYTNLSFTEKQKEDTAKLYDLVKCNGLIDRVVNAIPEAEYKELIKGVYDSIEAIYSYQNSMLGILENVRQDYGNLELDASNINAELSNPENIALLRDVLSKLG